MTEQLLYKDQARFSRLARGTSEERLALAFFFAAWGKLMPAEVFE